MDILPNAVRPTCEDINRACKLYNAGGTKEAFAETFGHLAQNELAYLWVAAQVNHEMGRRPGAYFTRMREIDEYHVRVQKSER